MIKLRKQQEYIDCKLCFLYFTYSDLVLGTCFDHQGTCWVLRAEVGGESPKDWDRPPKSNKAEASFIPGKKN